MKVALVIFAVMFATKAMAMPWPCWQVRLVAGGMSETEIWQYVKAKKIRVTYRLEREVRACLRKK